MLTSILWTATSIQCNSPCNSVKDLYQEAGCCIEGSDALVSIRRQTSETHPVFSGLLPEEVHDETLLFYGSKDNVKDNMGLGGDASSAIQFEMSSLAAAAAMKCEYCILSHKKMLSAYGVAPNDIKKVIMVAAGVAMKSTILYGSEYGLEAYASDLRDQTLTPAIFLDMFPSETQVATTAYLVAESTLFGDNKKQLELLSLSAAVGMKCEYCINYHKYMAAAAYGATDKEIKSTIFAASIVSWSSSMLYGSEYGIDKLAAFFG